MQTETSAPDIGARQDEITGKPPRIPPLTAEELGQDALTNMNNLRKGISATASTKVTDYVATMMRHPELYQAHVAVALKLFNGVLTVRDRELAILRTGWLCQAPFEFGEHVKLGKRLASLSDAEIERVTQGSAAPGWSAHDRAVIRAAEELHAAAMVSDETWAVLSKSLNEKQLIELLMVVGHYQKVAFIQNALRIRLTPDNPGLSAR
jgi:alkylhydroperoxidase family enzyme